MIESSPAARTPPSSPPFARFAKLRAPALAVCGLAATWLAPRGALAHGFATPPGDATPVASSRPVFSGDTWSSGVAADEDSVHDTVARLAVGPAGAVSRDSAEAGLLVAADFGRGAAGLRLQAAWLGVGREFGVAQYTGELTVEARVARRFRPRLGAGGGVARTGSSLRDDGSLDRARGATIGLGVVRAGVAYLLPLDADARVALDLSASIPAVRGDSAPHVGVYGVAALTVSLGF